VSIDYLLVEGVPRRPLHAAEHILRDHLAHVSELSEDDLAALVTGLAGLVAKNRLKTSPAGSADQYSLRNPRPAPPSGRPADHKVPTWPAALPRSDNRTIETTQPLVLYESSFV
jgi:hypothetical protein